MCDNLRYKILLCKTITQTRWSDRQHRVERLKTTEKTKQEKGMQLKLKKK